MYDNYYRTHDLELVVMVFALKMWRHYLYRVHFDVYTDHKVSSMILPKRCWISNEKGVELWKDYDISLLYHPDKTNMVADALSRVTISNMYHVEEAKKDLVKDVHRFARLGVRLEDSPNGGFMVHHNSKSSLGLSCSLSNTLTKPCWSWRNRFLVSLMSHYP